MKSFLTIISIVFLFSCEKEQSYNASLFEYFDSNKFLQNEIQKILASNPTIEKEIILNGEKEFKKIEKVDSLFLFNEFQFIADANINKPALYGKYELDTFALNARNAHGVEVIHYTYSLIDASNEKNKTKTLSSIHDLKTKEVLGCLFHLESKNFMHSFNKDIYYEKGTGIRVDAWEKTLFQDTIHYNTNLKID